MAQKKLFSRGLIAYTDVIENEALLRSLAMLQLYLRKRRLRLLKWDDFHLAIPLKISVELPPFCDIDIRAAENVLIVIDVKEYPFICPTVYTDRLDFPKDNLAHLYIAKEERPPAFCLVRGDMATWYANKHLKDIVIRTKNWLSDAAADTLSENSGQFDPLRLEGYRGNIVYNYDDFAGIVKTNKSFGQNGDFNLAIFENTGDSDTPTFVFKNFVDSQKVEESLKAYNEARTKLRNNDGNAPKYYVGYVVWDRQDRIHKDYDVILPKTWAQLKVYCLKYNVDLSAVEKFICEFNLDYLLEIPVIVGIKRPNQIIGFNSDIEFINFYLIVKVTDKETGNLSDQIQVKFQRHNQPLTIAKSVEISGATFDLESALIFGCGALGSKIAMHFARNGYTGFLIVDPDFVSAHNLTRHALLANSIGKNKARALVDEIQALFPHDKVHCIPVSNIGERVLTGKLKELAEVFDWIFDFTASETFFNILVTTDLKIKAKVCRTYLSDFGNIAITLLEGENRTIRLDDLVASLYYEALTNSQVSNWLIKEQKNNMHTKLVNVGIGCNSETSVLSDDVISLQAASKALLFKKLSKRPPTFFSTGHIFINEIVETDSLALRSAHIQVLPFVTVKANNDPEWEIRYRNGLISRLKSEMGKAMPNETGGIFIGSINYKTRTIHVVDVVDAPPDSQANPGCFFRGVKNLPEQIQEVQQKTGGQLGYIGEWHTHPFGPNSLSRTDFNTVTRFKSELAFLTTPMPVFLGIVTPQMFLSYVY